jgi:hypothetical protein
MGTLSISAKTSDLCCTTFTDKDGKETETDGYVPYNIGIGGGDYVDLEIDMKTGQIQNWKPVSDAQVKAAQKNS